MLLGWIATLAMAAAIFLIPLGLPGLWIMVGLVGLGTVLGHVGAVSLLVCVAAAAIAEVLEFLIIRRMSLRYGGSTRAFWGAVLGGFAGLFIGIPVPLIGPVLVGILGSFVGAALVSAWELKDTRSAARVGWGVVLARVIASVVKVGAAMVILVVGGAAWIFTP